MARLGVRKGRRHQRFVEDSVLTKLLAHFTDSNISQDVLPLTYGFYGVDSNCFKLSYAGETMVFEAIEDPDDGYRSYLKCIERPETSTEFNCVFPNTPIAYVNIRKVSSMDGFDGWQFFVGDHIWLEIGTDFLDDYYPCFIFRYQPDRNYVIDYEPLHVRGQIMHMMDIVEDTKHKLDKVLEHLSSLERNFSMAEAERLLQLAESENELKFLIDDIETLMDLAE